VVGDELTERRLVPLVLVVDDDERVRLQARRALETQHFVITEAADGPAAVLSFQRRQPDVVLIGVGGGRLDGIGVCTELRRLADGGQVPLVMMAGLDEVEAIERAYEAGASDFVTKPLNWHTLHYHIRYVLRERHAQHSLRRSEERFRQLAENLSEVFWITDLTGQEVVYVSPAYEQVFGRSCGSLYVRPASLDESIHPHDRDRVREAARAVAYGHVELEYRIVRPDGSERWVRDRRFPVRSRRGEVYRVAAIAEDITERKQAEERIEYMAYYDALTRLPNRALFMQRLARAVLAAQRQGGIVGLLFLDLDSFKRINDTLGHRVGDLLLQGVAERLRSCVRPGDLVARGQAEPATVARLGGDEFTVLLTEIDEPAQAARVAQRILETLTHPFILDGHEVFVTASVGMTIFPADGQDVESLLKNADLAMYAVKEEGRNGCQFFSAAMNAAAVMRLTTENELRRALERQEFVVHYQPQVDITTRRVVGVEALLRWHHPTRGLIAPAEFIAIAEETGLVVPLGEWVLRTACAQARAWQQEGLAPLRMSVNLSSRQFSQRSLAATVAAALAATGLPPGVLELELTERAVMQPSEWTMTALQALKGMGVRLAIDDFGTGYSSLGSLKKFPIDTLKIDRSFVEGLPGNLDNAAIVRAVVALARSLNLAVVGEGVETAAQAAFLRDQGCIEQQGFLLGRPAPPEELRAQLLGAERPVTGGSVDRIQLARIGLRTGSRRRED
jgi:diguanylate cyclase (GGDEF)-like protein/PAS domain S-box-containing protein